MSASIILIKTACGDLDFLVPVVDKLVEAIGSGMDYVRIQNADDIDSVLDRMRNSNYTRVIIFSHGREKELLGADLPLSGEHGPVWLNSSDQLAVLADKEIFCLACQSQSLGGAAIESGANAFLGFAEVPFHRFEGDEPRREPQLEDSCKQVIAHAAQISIMRWLIDGEPLSEVLAYFRLCVRRIVSDFARNDRSHPQRHGVILLNLALLGCSLRMARREG